MRILILLCSVFTAMACSNNREELPLSEEKMAHILADIHVAEAAIKEATGSDKDSLEQLYYQRIMKIHGVSRADFDSTLSKVHRNPDQLIHLYQRARAILDTLGHNFDED